MKSSKPSVLFVCVHNAGRSQMAAGFLRGKLGENVNVYSAGSEPKLSINPVAVAAMAEVGIDISQNQPQKLENSLIKVCDVVITMGCGDVCPIYAGKKYEDWNVEDPAGKELEVVRLIRDDIESRIDLLVEYLKE